MQQYVEYGFVRTHNMVEDGERRARRHVNVGPLPSPSKSWLRRAADWLSAGRTQQHRPRPVTRPTHTKQSAS